LQSRSYEYTLAPTPEFFGTLAESLHVILYDTTLAVTESECELDGQHAAHIPTCVFSPGRKSTLPALNLSEVGCSEVSSS